MTAFFDENFDVHDPVEVHWSSSTILAIFFAASLVSAVFFGLGYSFGGAGTGKHSLTFNTTPANSSAATPTVQPAKPTPLAASNQPSPITKFTDTLDTHPACCSIHAPGCIASGCDDSHRSRCSSGSGKEERTPTSRRSMTMRPPAPKPAGTSWFKWAPSAIAKMPSDWWRSCARRAFTLESMRRRVTNSCTCRLARSKMRRKRRASDIRSWRAGSTQF